MAKRAKNPAQLTEEEKDVVDQIILITGAVFTYITTKSPKDYAEDLVLNAKSKKRIGGTLLLLNIRNLGVGQVVTPAILNSELARCMLDHPNIKDPTDITTDGAGTTKNHAYINSSDMTEILSYLRIGNILQKRGKKEIRRLSMKGQRGRPPKNSDATNMKLPGRPSNHIITQNIEKLKALMSKPEACDRIRKVLVESRLIYKYLKLLFQALYYVARQDKSVADKMLRAFAPEIAKNTQIKESLEKFWRLDESDLDEVADEVSISAETHLRYDEFVFTIGIFDIMSKVAKNFII